MLEINFNEPASLGEEIGKYRPAGDRQSLDLLGNRRHYPQTSPQGNIALIASKLAWGKYLLRKRPHRRHPEKQKCPQGIRGQDSLKCPQHSKWFSNVLSSCKLLFSLHVFICNAYQKFGHFCKQNSKNKNKRAIYLNNDFYWLKMRLKRQIHWEAIPRKR